MSDIKFLHNEKELVYINSQLVGSIKVENGGNVLTHITVDEDKRGQGYSRKIINGWLEKCKSEEFSDAYVIMVNHDAIRHVLETLTEYECSKISPRNVPVEVRPGPHISDLSYHISLD